MAKITIPQSQLAQDLTRAAHLKSQATQSLRQLEEIYTGGPIGRPGRWRQDPAKWTKQTKRPS